MFLLVDSAPLLSFPHQSKRSLRMHCVEGLENNEYHDPQSPDPKQLIFIGHAFISRRGNRTRKSALHTSARAPRHRGLQIIYYVMLELWLFYCIILYHYLLLAF